MSVSVICSRFLAGLLVFMAAVGFVLHHQLNLSLLFATVFLLISGKDDREALQNSRADALLNGIRPLTEPVSAELIAVDASASPREALLAVRAGRRPLFAVYSHGRLQQIVDEQTLLDLLTINTTESRA